VVILSVSQLPTHMEEGSLPPGIRDHVFYLEGDHMHSSIQKVHVMFIFFSGTIQFVVCDLRGLVVVGYLYSIDGYL
jgi:hypothetical protein